MSIARGNPHLRRRVHTGTRRNRLGSHRPREQRYPSKLYRRMLRLSGWVMKGDAPVDRRSYRHILADTFCSARLQRARG